MKTLLLALASGLLTPAAAADKPNILIILADDLGWGELSCYPGDPEFRELGRVRTPNLDSLAAQGVRCTQGYASAPVCRPSRMGPVLGKYQQRLGWYGFGPPAASMPEGQMTIADMLKAQGYATACMGKWHLGFKPQQAPRAHGFDRFYGFLGGSHDYFDPTLGQSDYGREDHEAFIFDQDQRVEKMAYLTDELATQSMAFIDSQTRAKKPFFIYLAFNAVHTPLQPRPDKLEPWAKARGSAKFNQRDAIRAMAQSVDENVGRLLDHLMHLGIEDNTLILFSSDNGGQRSRAQQGELPGDMLSNNGGLRGCKMLLWEGGIRVPFIVRWPARVPKGLVYHEPVTLLDVFATAAAAAGASMPEGSLDGTDLIPFLSGKKGGAPHETLFWGAGRDNGNRWAIRQGRWKLTREFRDFKSYVVERPPSIVTELHDMETDPFEQHDVAKEHPELVNKLNAIKTRFFGTLPPAVAPEARADKDTEKN